MMLLDSVQNIPDLLRETYKLVAQVPEGKVTTYGAVARALGDIAASRYVGIAMSKNDDIVKVPCRRVIRSDGHVGGYSDGGTAHKIRLLRCEGIEIAGDRVVNLDDFMFDDFSVKCPPLRELKRRQRALRKHLRLKRYVGDIERVAGMDVAYEGDHSFAAMVTFDYRTHEELDWKVVEGHAEFPYVPTYLGFREIPLILPLMRYVKKGTVVMYDGNGILHPERFGITSQVGVIFDVPTVGVAKRLLCGRSSSRWYEGASRVVCRGRSLGYALVGPKATRPVYVSAGHLVSPPQALTIARAMLAYRSPEPVRMAHIVAEAARRGTSHK